MVIHGAIDGHSRMIVYLHCSNDNTAETVLGLFTDAVRTYGRPLRVRGDRGTENTKVAEYMINQGGTHCKNKSVVVTPNLGVKVLCTYDTLMGCHGP